MEQDIQYIAKQNKNIKGKTKIKKNGTYLGKQKVISWSPHFLMYHKKCPLYISAPESIKKFVYINQLRRFLKINFQKKLLILTK